MGNSPIAGAGISEDKEPEKMSTVIMVFCPIPAFSTGKVNLSIQNYENLKKFLEAAERLKNVSVIITEPWKAKYYRLTNENIGPLVTGEFKAVSHLITLTPSKSASHNKLIPMKKRC